ncbi:hypothetical protein Tco_1483651 [Tanacetum coccineum]
MLVSPAVLSFLTHLYFIIGFGLFGLSTVLDLKNPVGNEELEAAWSLQYPFLGNQDSFAFSFDASFPPNNLAFMAVHKVLHFSIFYKLRCCLAVWLRMQYFMGFFIICCHYCALLRNADSLEKTLRVHCGSVELGFAFYLGFLVPLDSVCSNGRGGRNTVLFQTFLMSLVDISND